MNRTELIRAAKDRLKGEAVGGKLSAKEVGAVLGAVLDSIGTALKDGEKVQLAGFGTFEVRKRAGCMNRNPRTGELVEIPERNIASFKAGTALKEAVNAPKE